MRQKERRNEEVNLFVTHGLRERLSKYFYYYEPDRLSFSSFPCRWAAMEREKINSNKSQDESIAERIFCGDFGGPGSWPGPNLVD